MAFRSADVGFEEVLVLHPYLAHYLGVPLDADEPLLREVMVLDSLYNSIGRAGTHRKTVTEHFDPLVMVGVDLGVLASGDLR